MRDIDRSNFGLTLDFGHCLMAGENPAQAVALVGKESRRLRRRPSATGRDHEDGFTTDEENMSNKLFGVQLGETMGIWGGSVSTHPNDTPSRCYQYTHSTHLSTHSITILNPPFPSLIGR